MDNVKITNEIRAITYSINTHIDLLNEKLSEILANTYAKENNLTFKLPNKEEIKKECITANTQNKNQAYQRTEMKNFVRLAKNVGKKFIKLTKKYIISTSHR